MPKWIRKVKHDLSAFRISIPSALIMELGWESCRYVVVEKFGDNGLLIGRMPGDDTIGHGGKKGLGDVDRSSGNSG